MIITIDGPSGTGKSTIAKLLAKKLNFEYFDTGAMYRAITYYILENDLDSDEKIVNSLGKFSFKIHQIDDGKEYFVNNTNVTHIIREDRITNNVSKFSSKKIIREFLVKIQKSYARDKNAVFEGRDMGSVVFPKANYKFFLTAKDRLRAKRRYLQLREKFPDANFSIEKILEEQKKRDEIDSNRKISPLKCPKNAIVLDTSNLTIKEVIENLMKKIKKTKEIKPHYTKMNLFYKICLFTIYWFFKNFYKLKIHGQENLIEGKAIIASNHVSFYDPPLVAASAIEEIHFLAKASLFKAPLLGSMIRKLNSHPVSRSASDKKIFRIIINLLKEGDKVLLFPEGERTFDGKLTKLLPGIGFIANLANAPIIPVYICGAHSVWTRGKKLPKLFGKISVTFGKPILLEEFKDLHKKEKLQAILNKVEKSLKELEEKC